MPEPIKMTEVSPGHFRLEPGRRVFCDWCNKEWTDSPESGGVYGLETKAFCPECAPEIEKSAKQYGELDHIYARCPEGKSFADWVREDLRREG